MKGRSFFGVLLRASLVLLVGIGLAYLFEGSLESLLLNWLQDGPRAGFLIGTILAVLVTFVYIQSITSQDLAYVLARRMNAELTMTSEQFKVLYESSPVPYIIVTPKGVITNPNAAACELFGLRSDELEGANLFDRLGKAKGDQIGIQTRLQHSLSAKRQELTLRVSRDDTRWVLFSMHEVATNGEFPHMGLVTMVDITEQKEIERKKTEFLSLASHQLRTPLSRIRWYADMMKEMDLGEKAQDKLRKLYRATLLMIETVNTLLNMTRMELGTLSYEPEELDVGAEVQAIVRDYEESASDKAIEVRVDAPRGLTIETDRKLFRVVADNLLTNALRYTPEKGKVRVSLTPADDVVRLAVEDTGVGIPDDAKDKIFTKQYRADNAKAMSNDGTGLGMYMTREIVALMKGKIEFVSQENQGTTFSVTLPKRV